MDRQGNVYGVTFGGGLHGEGTVFELTPGPYGWDEIILHSFDGSDGTGPIGGPTVDGLGNIYGTTPSGGDHHGGTVYKLASNQGTCTEETLYNFCAEGNCEDGGASRANLIMDNKGDLYGTGVVVFEVSPTPAGIWTESTLHSFVGKADGLGPKGGLIADRSGNLYGTTNGGGGSNACTGGCGTVYELSPVPDDPGGKWNERILHDFGASQSDGQLPIFGQLAIDRHGNLYGTTFEGGANQCGEAGCGVVFEVSRTTTGGWVERTIYNFMPGSTGDNPGGSVVIDTAGNLYGTTIYGGSQNCGCGVVYELSPQPGGQWQYTVLHTFVGADGAQPDANLTLDDNGNIYGTTLTGGPGGAGVVFEITP